MSQTMTDVALALSQSAEVSLIVKATVLMLLGLGAAMLARRARASVRSLAIAATFAGLIALPAAWLFAPALVIAVPVASARLETSAPSSAIARGAETAKAGASTSAVAPDSAWYLPSASTLARGAWALGTLTILGSLALSLWQVGRLRRTALPWMDGANRLRTLATDLTRRRPVAVLLHESVVAPFTCGTSRPAIVLPADAPEWARDDLDRALVHELEHIRRGDWAIQLVARATCALYWFHPLVWTTLRRLCLEAERACDDAVLACADGLDYADQLVALARRMTAASSPLLGMAQRSDLATRVSALLDGSQPRGRAGFGTALSVMSAAAIVVLGIAPLTAIARPPDGGAPAMAANAEPGQSPSKSPRYLGRALYDAAENGDLVAIGDLIAAGADVNVALQGDGSPLIAAARKGHVAAVRLLLDHGADPDLGVRGDGNALIMAAREGFVEVIGLLLDRGASIDLVVPGDENALIQASRSGELEAVQLLVRRGADVNARVWVETGDRDKDEKGEWRTPLGMARRERHDVVARFLVEHGARE